MKKLFVIIADSPEKRELGLMHKRSLHKDAGMLFKFPYAHRLRFWMKNTYIPLDIAFIDDDGEIMQIETMNPLSTRAITSSNPCKYALEVNAGWFSDNSILVGDKIISEAIRVKLKQLAQVVKKPNEKDKKKPIKIAPTDKITDNKTKKEKEKSPIESEPIVDKIDKAEPEAPEIPEEMDVEGEYDEQPNAIQAVPYEGGENPQIEIIRDIRGKIKVANEHLVEMEILYLTKNGYRLPPRRVRPIKGGKYLIKNGPNGEYLVAFDASPTINSGTWSIKGLQEKSFLLDNIYALNLIDAKGKALTDEQISNLKNGNMLATNQQNLNKNKKKNKK